MTPDELPADMEGLIENVALPWIESEEMSVDPEDLTKAGQAVRALLKAYQEQRRALERLAGVEAVLGQGQGGIARDTDYARRVASDLRLLLSERAELLTTVERMRDCLLGIALSDRYRRYPKQHEDGGVRGQSGLRAIRALTGQHGSYLNDEDVVRLDKEARAALTTGEEK